MPEKETVQEYITAEDGTVAMFVTRESGYHYRGQGYGPGQVLWMSAASAKAMQTGTPPFGRPATTEEVDLLAPTQRDEVIPTSPFAEPNASIEAINATQAALDHAIEYGMDLRIFNGRGTGKDGQITAKDVDGWAKDQGLDTE
jgi:pyruvate/2-oxoglutarate dehydrogenase complex dihydrolipoamide acyltransferase (E2) component